MRAGLLESEYEAEQVLVKSKLAEWAATEPHWQEYLKTLV
jgi:hypothetical protein